MRKLIFTLLMIISISAVSQNGGQYFENNVARIYFVSKTSTTATFRVISKQNCTAKYKVDYGPVVEISLAAFDSMEFSVPVSTAVFKTKAEASTACTNQPDLGWVEIIVLTVLPVKLISFKGVQNNDLVTLSCEFVNETVSKFDVEKSIDGRNFTTVATINKIAGYGSKDYHTTDHINSVTYYRLKMYDEYDRPEYSKIITFRGKSAYKFKLYGNPVTDKISFTINSSSSEKIKLNMMDMQGRIVLSRYINVMAGENIIDVPVSNISKGVYHIVVTTRSEIFNERVINL